MKKERNPENHEETAGATKFELILNAIRQGIGDGSYPPGARLPAEIEIARTFRVSRPTVAKALNKLEHDGLVERIAGSGTYVKESAARDAKLSGKVFGLLIPGLGATAIFEPICGRMAACSEAGNCTLLWGGCEPESSGGESVRQLCTRYIRRRLDGVFFAPLELIPDKDKWNLDIISALEEAGIPVVLLDRDAVPFPQRTAHDLVGLDNVRAAYQLTAHLIDRGCSRIHFLARPYAAPTLEERLSGYRQALIQAGIRPEPDMAHQALPDDPGLIAALLDTGADAVICSNDANAIALINALEKQGIRVPQHIKIAGFDDVAYARHAKVALTTVRQPCADLGTTAFHAMTTRLLDPQLPPRTIQLHGELVIRQSTGG